MLWLLFGFVFVLSAGFAKVSTSILNRMISIPQPKLTIAISEALQLLLMPLYSILLLACLLGNGHWLKGRPWYQVSTVEAALILVGAFGVLLLIRATVIFQSYRPPACQLSDDSRMIDFRESCADGSWRSTFVGERPMRRVALLPGNQQFLLEVCTKTYSLPRLPIVWDGLSIVHLADTHFRGAVTRAYFEAVFDEAIALKPDLFVFTGDLLDDLSRLDWLPQTLGKVTAPLGQYFILGNHDWHLDSRQIRRQIEQCGWIDLSDRCVELPARSPGPPIVLAGDETPWMGSHPDLSQVSSDAFRILVSHTPDNFDWARTQGIDLMLSGHTHGGQIRLPLLGPVYSPSRYGCRYASGVFWKEPTLMYVSRGISGREPIRYNCPPEITKLVLRTGRSDPAEAKIKGPSLA